MRKGTCKHFLPPYANNVCAAGVCYRDVTPEPDEMDGVMLRLPCHTLPWKNATDSQLEHFARRGTCDKFEEPSAEEIKAYEAEVELGLRRYVTTLPLIARIKKEHRGQEWAGVEECPVCKGKLRMTHSALNGHVWGNCATEDCLSWME